MTAEQYILCTEEEKNWLLHSHAVEIATRSAFNNNYILFQLDGFYIELEYCLFSRLVTTTNIFSNMLLLDPYLDKIIIHLYY
jgi:hypothetical protein